MMTDAEILAARASSWSGCTGPCDWCENTVRYDSKNRLFDNSGSWIMVMCFRCRMTEKVMTAPVVFDDEPF